MAHKQITRALREGCRLHAFRSGGGLRVIRVEKGKKDEDLLGYGEHPHVEEALRLADRTLRPIIGRIPKKSRWLTGSSSASSDLDSWILRGHTFDAWAENDTIVFQMIDEWHHDEVPEDVLQKAVQEGSAEWQHRGGTYLIYRASYHPHRSAHRYDYSTRAIKEPTQGAAYRAAKTGQGQDFDEALAAALAAPLLEILEQKAA